MKVLVLGGSRFIGLHIVLELLRQGHQVAVFNRGRSQGAVPPEVQRLQGDRHDAEQVRLALAGQQWDAVIDVTAYSGHDVQTAIDLLRSHIRHYVFISTGAVYAPTDLLPIDETFSLWGEASAPSYSAGKVQCEEALAEAFTRDRFPYTSLRASYVYGPDNYLYDREASFFYRLAEGRPILVPLGGGFVFHHGHVDDLARACAAVLGNDRAVGQVYNITGPYAATANGYLRTLARVVGVELRPVYLPLETLEEAQASVFPYAWERSTVFAIEKARKELGWSPEYDLEAGHRQTYRWFQRQGLLEKLAYDFSYEDQLLARYGRGQED